jgi:type IV secretory pathway TraG/TraD family ATPase VirD4
MARLNLRPRPEGRECHDHGFPAGQGSAHSEGMGQSVRVLDPFQSSQVDDAVRARFNPLDALDPEKEETIDEAGRIADALVVVHEQGNDPFWDESARAMVKGLILHVITDPKYKDRRNLVTVRQLILRGDWEMLATLEASADPGKALPPAQALLWLALRQNPALNGLIAGIGDSFFNMFQHGDRQYDSVLQVANRNTEFIDSPAMQRSLEGCDFQLAELKTRPEGLSLFLCLPQRYMSTHYRWLRMMISLTVTEMEKVRGRPATGHPILMMLDEFAGLKRMEVVENAVAQIAGYGVKMFFVLQSLEQLKAIYKDNWETFLANSGLKVFFNLEDNFSRDYVSKLIGETEVIREVRTSSDSVSESESTSHSTSKSSSETRGRSSSTSTSETEGTSKTASSGTSGGVNSSRTTGEGGSSSLSWTPSYFFWMELSKQENRQRSEGVSRSSSETEGESSAWNKGQSSGTSQSASRSRTEGTSESVTTGTSETDGTTRGTSKSRTTGENETIQKRALVTPDEIGQLFGRVDDKARAAYPGMALIVFSGARPIAVRRVNYFEDYQFIGLFDPNPDYPFAAWVELSVEGNQLGFALADYGLSLGAWAISVKQIAAGGSEAVAVLKDAGATPAAWIRVPRLGAIRTIPAAGQSQLPPGPVFSLRYYEDGAALIDPFADIRALRTASAPPARRKAPIAALAAVGLLILVIVAVIMSRSGGEGSSSQDRPPQGNPVAVSSPPNPPPPIPEVRPEPPPVQRHLAGTPTLARTLQHGTQEIRSVVYAADGRLLASGGDEDSIKLWDAATGELRRALPQPSHVWSLAFSHDGKTLAAGLKDGSVKLWDTATYQELRTLGGHTAGVSSVAFSPDGRILASGSEDNTIRFRDPATGQELRTLALRFFVRSLAFSPDGQLLVSADGDGTIKLWNVATGRETNSFRVTSASLSSIVFSPDGHTVAYPGPNNSISLWTLASGGLVTLTGHTGTIWSLAFDPQGRVLASGGNGQIRLWDAVTWKEAAMVPIEGSTADALAFSPNGGSMAAGLADGTIRLWNVPFGQ